MAWNASKVRYEIAVRSAERAKKDVYVDVRKAERLCIWCFYFDQRLSGQAFTSYSCAECKKEHRWRNTAVPPICEACADKDGVCQRCREPREWQEERRG